MQTFARRRPRLVLFPTKSTVQAKAGQTEDDYAVYASYRPLSCGRYIGTLKVIRLTDARLLYPFEGAEDIGPLSSKDAAREAAIQRGREIILADLQDPELQLATLLRSELVRGLHENSTDEADRYVLSVLRKYY